MNYRSYYGRLAADELVAAIPAAAPRSDFTVQQWRLHAITQIMAPLIAGRTSVSLTGPTPGGSILEPAWQMTLRAYDLSTTEQRLLVEADVVSDPSGVGLRVNLPEDCAGIQAGPADAVIRALIRLVAAAIAGRADGRWATKTRIERMLRCATVDAKPRRWCTRTAATSEPRW